MENIDNLIYKLVKIKNLNWIKCDGNNCGKYGLKLENLLGLENNNFEFPDYEGIEIKTKRYKSKERMTLFNATPDNTFFEISRIYNKYGYKQNNNNSDKNFNISINACERTHISKNYFQLYVDFINNKIRLLVFDKDNNLLENQISWSYEMLMEKFYRKFNIFCLVEIITKTNNKIDYFKILRFNIYIRKNFYNFIEAINSGNIVITFKIGTFKSGKRMGQIHDRGTGFTIDINYLDKIFDKL